MPRKLTLVASILLLTPFALGGCAATPSPEAKRIIEARSQDVAGCQMVKEVYGTAEGFYLSESAALTHARNMALEQAAAARATHVVWTNIEEGLSSYLRGIAYLC